MSAVVDGYEAFKIARKMGRPNSSSEKAIKVGSVRLYSHDRPLQEGESFWHFFRDHFSLSRLHDRLRHTSRKDSLYFDAGGEIYYPSLEIQLPSKDTAYCIQAALAPLSPTYSPVLTPLLRFVVRTVTSCLTMRRRLAGEKVLTFYCAEDRSYFGSVYINPRGQFISILGSTREAVEGGMRRIESFLNGCDLI